MENIIICAVLALIAGSIIFYLIRAKKSGAACVGCPHAKRCGSKCDCGHK